MINVSARSRTSLRNQSIMTFSVELVEVGSGLVSEQHGGCVDESASDYDASLLARGQFRRITPNAIPETELLHKRIGIMVDAARLSRFTKQRGERHIIDNAERRQQARELVDEADAAVAEFDQSALRETPDLYALNADLAARRPAKPSDHREEGRFAGTRTADDADELPAAGNEIDAPYRLNRTALSSISFGQVRAGHDHSRGHGMTPLAARFVLGK